MYALVCLYPSVITEACDLLVYNGLKYLRVEVKSSISGEVKLTRTLVKGRDRTTLAKYSEADKVDIFIFVDLTRQTLFIFRAEDVISHTSFNLSYTGEKADHIFNYDIIRNFY